MFSLGDTDSTYFRSNSKGEESTMEVAIALLVTTAVAAVTLSTDIIVVNVDIGCGTIIVLILFLKKWLLWIRACEYE